MEHNYNATVRVRRPCCWPCTPSYKIGVSCLVIILFFIINLHFLYSFQKNNNNLIHNTTLGAVYRIQNYTTILASPSMPSSSPSSPPSLSLLSSSVSPISYLSSVSSVSYSSSMSPTSSPPSSSFPLSSSEPTDGFIVLGMHRSGTSMLTGMLVKAYGYRTGGPLLEPQSDNEKGYFELKSLKIQNDNFFKRQGLKWNHGGLGKFNAELSWKDVMDGNMKFQFGKEVLQMIQNGTAETTTNITTSNQTIHHDYDGDDDDTNMIIPWVLKDPRMRLTLPIWLQLIQNNNTSTITISKPKPAILFTYRHPLDVANSLLRRATSKDFDYAKAFKLWIIYNQAAIQNSMNLCRVHTKEAKIVMDPLREIQRLVTSLTKDCQVLPPPLFEQMNQEALIDFFDDTLTTTTTTDGTNNNTEVEEEANSSNEILVSFNDGNCIAYDYNNSSSEVELSLNERSHYLKAMQVYCDMESGQAFKEGYEFPIL